MNHRRLCAATLSAIACLAAACSDKNPDSNVHPVSGTSTVGSGGGQPSGSGGAGGIGQAGAGHAGSSITLPDASYLDSGPVDATCAGSVSEARLIPLDLFIMLDQSSSMDSPVGTGTDTRWTAVTKAIGNFVQQPEAAGLGVGINYFGVAPNNNPMCAGTRPTCTKDSDCAMGCGPCVPFMPGSTVKVCKEVLGGAGVDQCDVTNYAKAETPIAPLPGNAQPILASLARHMPSTGTPSSAALQGSTDFCRQWAMAHPDHVVVNVFATDGEPEDCDLDPMNIANIAGQAFNATPSVRTFAIGVGDDLAGDAGSDAKLLMDGIAQAGGTMKAFLISDANVNQQFLAALNKIRGSSLACTYAIPDSMGGMPDIMKVNVRYTPGSGMPVVIPKVADAADCAGRDGWYYDNPTTPTRIIMCDATCQKFSMDSTGKVEIQVGCQTIIAPPR
jgi:hypothetical protein